LAFDYNTIRHKLTQMIVNTIPDQPTMFEINRNNVHGGVGEYSEGAVVCSVSIYFIGHRRSLHSSGIFTTGCIRSLNQQDGAEIQTSISGQEQCIRPTMFKNDGIGVENLISGWKINFNLVFSGKQMIIE